MYSLMNSQARSFFSEAALMPISQPDSRLMPVPLVGMGIMAQLPATAETEGSSPVRQMPRVGQASRNTALPFWKAAVASAVAQFRQAGSATVSSLPMDSTARRTVSVFMVTFQFSSAQSSPSPQILV